MSSSRCPAPRNLSHAQRHRERAQCAELLARAVGSSACTLAHPASQMNCLQLAVSSGYWRAALHMARCATAETLYAACAPDDATASRQRRARASAVGLAPLVLSVQADDCPQELLSLLLAASKPSVVGEAIADSARFGNIAQLRQLVASGDVDAGVLFTALRAAISASQGVAVDFLLPQSSFDKQACIPLAVRVGSWDILSLLLSHSNSSDSDHHNPIDSSTLLDAILRGHFAVALNLIRLMEDAGRWNEVQQTTLPSLLRAAGLSNATAVLPSLLCGAESATVALNQADEFGLTPMHFAQAHRHAEIAVLFVEAGASKVVRPRRMRTVSKVNTSISLQRRDIANIKYLESFITEPEVEYANSATRAPESLHLCSDAAAFDKQDNKDSPSS